MMNHFSVKFLFVHTIYNSYNLCLTFTEVKIISLYNRNFNRSNLVEFLNLLKCHLNFSVSDLVQLIDYNIHMVHTDMVSHTSLILESSGAKCTFQRSTAGHICYFIIIFFLKTDKKYGKILFLINFTLRVLTQHFRFLDNNDKLFRNVFWKKLRYVYIIIHLYYIFIH